jgi:Ni/Co efflux regulator RcnB
MRRLAIAFVLAAALLPSLAAAHDGAQGGDWRGGFGARWLGGEGRGFDHPGGDRIGRPDERGWDVRRPDRDAFGEPGREPPPYRGPGPDGYPSRDGVRWGRGQYLPPAFRGSVVRDYDYYHLRRPPPGYSWYRSGDDFILSALGSGLIFEVISADGY